jgi:hypothetical protein
MSGDQEFEDAPREASMEVNLAKKKKISVKIDHKEGKTVKSAHSRRKSSRLSQDSEELTEELESMRRQCSETVRMFV